MVGELEDQLNKFISAAMIKTVVLGMSLNYWRRGCDLVVGNYKFTNLFCSQNLNDFQRFE